jgi:integrase
LSVVFYELKGNNMASLSTNDAGLHRVYFKAADGRRQCLYLGRIPKKQAEGIERCVADLERANLDGSTPSETTSRWLAEVSEELHARLAKFGMVRERIAEAAAVVVTLGELVARFKARPKWANLKIGTQESISRAIRHLLLYFDATTPITKITAADADDFYENLRLPKATGGAGLAVSTANLVGTIVSSIFAYAVDAELIAKNHFAKLPRGGRRGNNTMVSHETSVNVLAAITGTEDRLVYGLARWGGLRTISEHRQLRWGDVDWAGNRLLVHSPKNERHHGKATRWIPLFPEIAKLLEDRFNEAAEGEEFILPSYRHADRSKAGHMLRVAIRRAGVELWSRLWHSLRATRQSELAEHYPVHVVSAWIGNSAMVAEKHYLMVTPEHFAKATQNPMQHPPARTDNEPKRTDSKSA